MSHKHSYFEAYDVSAGGVRRPHVPTEHEKLRHRYDLLVEEMEAHDHPVFLAPPPTDEALAREIAVMEARLSKDQPKPTKSTTPTIHIPLPSALRETHMDKPIRLTYVSELRSDYPDIKLPADIDLQKLEKLVGAGNLEFVTLPIGEVNAQSRNGRNYTRASVEELVKQVNELRPEGRWGHLTPEEMSTRYDPPAIRWLAAVLDKDGVAWAKGLPLTKDAREYFALAKATNARVGTSLVAWAEMKQDRVEHLTLSTIDIADPQRVGVPTAAAKPMLSKESK